MRTPDFGGRSSAGSGCPGRKGCGKGVGWNVCFQVAAPKMIHVKPPSSCTMNYLSVIIKVAADRVWAGDNTWIQQKGITLRFRIKLPILSVKEHCYGTQSWEK